MLDQFERFTNKLSSWFEMVGAVAIILMMIITCIDVVGAKIFLRPLPGSFDVIVLGQLIVVIFAAAFALVLGMHVKVDFVVDRFTRRTQNVISSIVNFFSLVLFILIIWRIFLYGYDLQMAGEVSPEIRVPFYPFAYAIAFASIPVCFALIVRSIKSITGVLK